uniref:Gamma-soluble NSF attachment protein n=1 Tax=Saccoglossus kowalevskii TaxID=10224 RepID=A0ABM0MYP5_SACKO|nr:PREDICTED: gamma-soluble NSF attachment protein-like [Saccoglossus kowalevskii]
MAASEKKINEGMEHISQAEKYLKTSFFKWKPDFDSASDEFSKAATCFKNAKSYDQAKTAYLRAAHALKNNHQLFHAAKAYEGAALMLKEMKNLDGAGDLMEQAAQMYREHGTPDTAALTLEKAAKMLENTRPEKAVELYERACEVAELEDRPRQAVNSLSQAAKLLVRIKEFDKAVAVLKREREIYAELENLPSIYRNIVATSLVHLQRGDFVAADQTLKHGLSYPGFAENEMYNGLQQLLDAYDEQDQERLNQVAWYPVFTYMDNDYAKLAKSIHVPGGGVKKPTSGASEGAIGDDNEGEEDEYAGGLC